MWRASGQAPEMLWLVPQGAHNRIFSAHTATYLDKATTLFASTIK